jgi:hypothetical protein
LLGGLFLSLACDSVPELKLPLGRVENYAGYYQNAPNEEPKDINQKPNTYYLNDIPGPQDGWPEGYQKFIVFAEVWNYGFDGTCVFNANIDGDVRGDKTLATSIYLKENTGMEITFWWFVKGEVSLNVQAVNLTGLP